MPKCHKKKKFQVSKIIAREVTNFWEFLARFLTQMKKEMN